MTTTWPPPEPTPNVPDKWAKALDGMRDTVFLASQKHQDQHQRADRTGAHPGIVGAESLKYVGFEKTLIRRMAKLGVPMFASEVNRDGKRQDELKRQGFSKSSAGKSAHQYGCAVDIIHGTRGWELTDQQWAIIGHVGKQIRLGYGWSLVWGGNDGPGDKFAWDPAHWQMEDWRDYKRAMDHSDIDGTPVSAEFLAMALHMAKNRREL